MTTPTSADPPQPAPPDRAAPGRPLRRSLHRGDPGVWPWVLHRITGATIFFYLFVHVLDTALVRVSPQTYDEVIEIYKSPVVGLLELGLVAVVVFHALNGIRIVVTDFWLRAPRYQRLTLWLVGSAWLLVMVPAAVVMAAHILRRVG